MSLYGAGKYGVDLYSADLWQLEGTISLTFAQTGDLREVFLRKYQGAITFAPVLAGQLAATYTYRGALTSTYSLSGRLTESEPLQGAVFFVPILAGRITESPPLQGAIVVGSVLTGILADWHGFRAQLVVQLDPHGELSRPGVRLFEGLVEVFPVISARLSREWHLPATNITVDIDVESAEIYFGPFWIDDVPLDTEWNPEEPPPGFWTPQDNSGVWTPVI